MEGMTADRVRAYAFVDVATGAAATFTDRRLAGFTERHAIELQAPPATAANADLGTYTPPPGVAGVVFSLQQGVAGRRLLQLCQRLSNQGHTVYFYWPNEGAVEVIDEDRRASYWRLWLLGRVHNAWRRITGDRQRPLSEAPAWTPAQAMNDVMALQASARPTAISPEKMRDGVGVYLRLDFWAPTISGGSYGHTVYQAKALARSTRDFVAIVANPFPMLDELGVRQVVVRPPTYEGSEAHTIEANNYYENRLRPVLAALRPAFVFERLVLGNYVAAKLCQELAIPYIAEYNGSEISMMRSFSNKSYDNEGFYLASEALAFKQASVVSVVSEHVGADVKARVPGVRVLINPNAVDLAAYAPPSDAERAALRAELGVNDGERLVGFTGTFGGWHGIDVLAKALPQILRRAPRAKFLLIGDGPHKPSVRGAIAANNLGGRVIDVGRVSQSEGARLLKACDVLVAPHSGHMVDSKFFGSPTKLFEYMGVGAGIVASDLEQIGEVLSPALRVRDIKAGARAGEARGVLCAPGDASEFTEAVLALVENPELSAKLGANARAAAERYYTWDEHVANLWATLAGGPGRGFQADLAAKRATTKEKAGA